MTRADLIISDVVISDVPSAPPPCTPTPGSPTLSSPVGSPRCISPEAIDEKLLHYVGLFGSRWALIRCHMQVAFSVAFPARYLEKRWQTLQQQKSKEVAPPPALPTRSPLARMDDAQQEQLAMMILPPQSPPGPGCGIQERLPLNALSPSPKAKRWREDGTTSPTQPARPPPPSPHSQTKDHPLPKGLAQGLCPTFLLAPGSALAAPEAVRRQLKAVYLASLITKENREQQQQQQQQQQQAAAAGGCCSGMEVGGSPLTDDEAALAAAAATATGEADASMDIDDDPVAGSGQGAPPSSFASEEEKRAIASLLSRELKSFQREQRRPRSSTDEAERGSGAGRAASKSPTRRGSHMGRAPLSPSNLSPAFRRSGATVASPQPADWRVATKQLSRRWPSSVASVR